MKKRYFGFFGFVILTLTIFGQSLTPKPLKGAIYKGINNDTCYFSNEIIESKIINSNPRFKKYLELQETNSEEARAFQNSLATSEIIINFSDAFEANQGARNAFRFAADMWEMEVVSSVPIIINADLQPLGSGVIAQNGSPAVSNVPNSPDPTVSYNTSLANAIAGVDLIPGQADLFQTYSSDFDFYFGTNLQPGTRTDFVTIALHEIGHGMGISGSTNGSLGVGDNAGNNPRSWDTFVEIRDETSILSLGFGSQEQRDALVSNDLYINSFNTNAALNGIRARIYAPITFSGGSSFSHWDESTFPAGDPNSLMTPFNGRGEANHDIGDITRGILRDMGWVLAPESDFDLGIATISAPLSGQSLSDSEMVSIIVGNLGSDPVSNVEVSYSINDGDVITEIFPETINPGEEKSFTFSTLADLSEGGQSYRIVASVDYFIDEYEDNNSTFRDVNNLLPVNDFPYTESFENGAGGWTVEGTNGVWELGEPDGTILNEASDGNFAWATRLSGNYPDASTASVLSPAFNLTGLQDPIFSFDISYDIETGWDGAALQYSIDNGATWATIGEFGDETNWYTDGDARTAASDQSEGANGIDALSASVSDGDGWTGAGSNGTNGYVRATRIIEGVGGEANIILRVIFSSDSGVNNEGFVFDNVEIITNPLEVNDLGIVAINNPTSGALSNSEVISVEIKNYGSDEQSNFTLSYQIDENAAVSETFTSSIQPGETEAFSFAQTADLSSVKVYNVLAQTELANDAAPGNDQFSTSVSNFTTIASFPYKESFESNDHFWTVEGQDASWERVTPGNSIINSSSEGSFAFVTNGSGDYLANEQSVLLSPGFNFSAITNPAISFDIWYDTENATDGVILQSSINNGESWEMVGELNDIVNWYNQSGINFGTSDKGWSGSSNQYIKTFNQMVSLANESFVLLRFLFVSDNDIQGEGIAIDNITIFDEANVDFTLECAEDLTLSTDAGLSTKVTSFSNPTVSNGVTPIFYNDYNNNSVIESQFLIGSTTINFLVESGGRFALCTSNVIIEDNESPVIDCPNEIVVAIPAGSSSASIDYQVPTVTDNFGFPILVTYQVDNTVDGVSGVACPTGPNSYLRAFDLVNDFNINSDFNLQSVDVGFQVNAAGVVFEAKANIYTFDGQNLDINNPDDFLFENLNLIASSNFSVDTDNGDQVVTVPISAVIPAGQTAVLEVFTEVGSDITFPGANPNVTGGSSFLAGPACGISEPADVRFVGSGFEDAQFVMFLNGVGNSSAELQLASGSGSGGEFSLGDNTETYTIVDFFGNETTCSFNLKLVEAVLDAPVANDASDITSNSFTANWSVIDGAADYSISVSYNNFQTTIDGYKELVVVGNSALITGLNANSAYQYKVIARNASDGISEVSNTVETSTTIASPVLNSAIDITSSEFRITWSQVQGIREYEIDVSSDGFSTLVDGFDKLLVTENQTTVSGLDNLTTYSVRVRAINSGGQSVNSNTVTVTTFPIAPKAIDGTAITNNSFVASWNLVDQVTEYLVEVSADGFRTFLDGFDGLVTTDNTVSVSGLAENTTYMYRVKAISSGSSSLFSNQIRVMTLANMPVALSPDEITSYGFKAKWEVSPNVLTYELDISTDNFDSYLQRFNAKRVNNNSILISGLEAGETYQYRVRAVNRKGVITENSNTIELTLPSETISLNAPVAVEASEIAILNFTANWNASNGALFYNIELSKDDFVSLLPEYTGINIYTTFFTFSNLEPETEYKYRVRAFNNDGFSEYSNSISITTRPPLSIIDSDFGGITIYPNPVVNGKIGLLLSDKSLEEFSLSLIDLNGKILINRNFNNFEANDLFELNVSDFANGTYVLKMTAKEFSKSFKILINAK